MRMFHFLVALATGFAAATASADAFPDRSKIFKIILPQGPGSAADGLARAYARALAEVANLNVIVDYKPGAEAIIGVQALKSSAPDGYTMMLSSSSTQVTNVLLVPNLPYDPFTDFAPLTGVSRAVLTLSFARTSPFTTAREFIAAARAQPGKYTIASSTSSNRLAGELLQSSAGIKLLNVPYKTTGAAVTALAAGQVDAMLVDPASASATDRVRPVATSGSARARSLPALPTLREEGVSGYEMTAWYSLYYPAKTPADVAAAMREILRKAARTAVVVDALRKAQMEPLDLTGDEVTALNRRELDALGKVVRAANLGPQQ